MTKQQILTEAKQLPVNEREELIEELRQMITPNELKKKFNLPEKCVCGEMVDLWLINDGPEVYVCKNWETHLVGDERFSDCCWAIDEETGLWSNEELEHDGLTFEEVLRLKKLEAFK